jgi:hypothetical protein
MLAISSPVMVHDDTPRISVEAQGRRRRWERQAAGRFKRVVELCESDTVGSIASDFAHKSGRGRDKARARLRQMFDPFGAVASEGAIGSQPRLFYSIVGGPLPDLFKSLDTDPAPALTPQQRLGVSVYYVGLGRLAGIVVVRGVWGCSLTDLGPNTWFERSSNPDGLAAALTIAHRCSLAAPDRNVMALLEQDVFLPIDGDRTGYFWSTGIGVRSTETKAAVFHCRLRAYLPEEMTPDGQIEASAELLKLRPSDTPLVGGALHPLHLRRPAAASAVA